MRKVNSRDLAGGRSSVWTRPPCLTSPHPATRSAAAAATSQFWRAMLCINAAMLSCVVCVSVCLCGRPSRSCIVVETNKHILKLLTIGYSNTILAFLLKLMAIFWREPPNGGAECRWSVQNRNFWPISCFISEMIQDRDIVTIERQLVWDLSSNDFLRYYLEWPLTQISRSRYY